MVYIPTTEDFIAVSSNGKIQNVRRKTNVPLFIKMKDTAWRITLGLKLAILN
jgi:hypothetical protein